MPVQYSAGQLRRKYDELAPDFDRLDWLPDALLLRRMRRSLLRSASGKVLEVAVGTGKNLPYYPPGCCIIGVDLSGGMLEQARQRVERLGLDVRLLQMDAEHLDFPDASFDTVTSTLSTCTFPDPVAALREMRRVCRPGGQILLLEHGRSSLGLLGRLQDRTEDGPARRFGCHWNREPDKLVRRAGLTVRRERRSLLGTLHLIEALP